MNLQRQNEFASRLIELSIEIHENAKEHGFWPKDFKAPNPLLNKGRNDGEMIALMHSELSEALEACRKPKIDINCKEHSNLAIELADCIIRILDFCYAQDINIAEAILSKHEFNKTREYKHGKNF